MRVAFSFALVLLLGTAMSHGLQLQHLQAAGTSAAGWTAELKTTTAPPFHPSRTHPHPNGATAAASLLTPDHYVYTDSTGVNHALRRADGTEAWNASSPGIVGYAANAVYLSGNDKDNSHLRSYDASSGAELWALGSGSGLPSRAVFTESGLKVTAQFSNDAQFVSQVSAIDGSVQWTFPSVSNDIARSQCASGTVAGVSSGTSGDFVTRGISLSTGKQLWSAPVFGDVMGCYANGTGSFVVMLNDTNAGYSLVTVNMASGAIGISVPLPYYPGEDSAAQAGVTGDRFCYMPGPGQAPKPISFACYSLNTGARVFHFSRGAFVAAHYGAKYITLVSAFSTAKHTQFVVEAVQPADGTVTTSVTGRVGSASDSLHFSAQIDADKSKILLAFSKGSGSTNDEVHVVDAAAGSVTAYSSGVSLNTLRAAGVQYDAATSSLFLLTEDRAVKLANVN